MEVSAKIHTFAIEFKTIEYEKNRNIIDSLWGNILVPNLFEGRAVCGSYLVEKGNKLVCSQETCGYVESKEKEEEKEA